MLNQLGILSVVQTYTCITSFVRPLSDLEYVTFLQRFFFLENSSLTEVEFVKLKPEKWKTQKNTDCKWFSVWEICMNIMTNSLLCSAPNLAVWLQKGITHCQQYIIYKLDTGICDTEKPMQLLYRGRVLLPQSPDQWQLRQMEMQILPSITTGVKHHPPSINLMNNTGCNGSSGTERLVNTHHCFCFFIFFLPVGRFFLFFHPVF